MLGQLVDGVDVVAGEDRAPGRAAQRCCKRAWRGMSPNWPERKSRNAWAISASVFITNGPPIAAGCPIGSPL